MSQQIHLSRKRPCHNIFSKLFTLHQSFGEWTASHRPHMSSNFVRDKVQVRNFHPRRCSELRKLWCKFTATVPHVLIGWWLLQLDLTTLTCLSQCLQSEIVGKLKFCLYINTDFGEIYTLSQRSESQLPFWDGMSCSSPRSLKKVAISLHW